MKDNLNKIYVMEIALSWKGKISESHKGRFTRYDSVACGKLTTGLRHELSRVNQTYNPHTTVVYVTKDVVGFKTCFKILRQS